MDTVELSAKQYRVPGKQQLLLVFASCATRCEHSAAATSAGSAVVAFYILVVHYSLANNNNYKSESFAALLPKALNVGRQQQIPNISGCRSMWSREVW